MRLLPRSSTSRAQVEGQSCGQTEWPMASLAGAFMGVLGGGDTAHANRVRGDGQERWRGGGQNVASASPGWHPQGPPRPRLAHDVVGLKAERELEFGVFGAIGTVYGVALDAFGKFLADAAGSGLGRIGGPHHIAVSLDSVLALQNLHHDGAGGHEPDKIAVERAGLVHLVEGLGLLPAPALAPLRNDAQARLLDQGIDGTGLIAGGGIRLDNRQGALNRHPLLLVETSL